MQVKRKRERLGNGRRSRVSLLLGFENDKQD